MLFPDKTQNYIQYPTLTQISPADLPIPTAEALLNTCEAQIQAFQNTLDSLCLQAEEMPLTIEAYNRAQVLYQKFPTWKRQLQALKQQPPPFYTTPAIACYGVSSCLNRYGQVRLCDEENSDSQEAEQWKNIRAIAAGVYIVGLTQDGHVLSTRRYRNDEDVSSWQNIQAISAGEDHVVGLTCDGHVLVAGDKDQDTSTWKNIQAISAGFFTTFGLTRDGHVLATGRNEEGQCNVSSWENIRAISAGYINTAGLTQDGHVLVIGEDIEDYADTNTWENIQAISFGSDHIVGLTQDGHVLAAGANQFGQCNVEDWENIVHIQASWCTTLGIQKDGTVLITGVDADQLQEILNR